jgi:hypothetical protein
MRNILEIINSTPFDSALVSETPMTDELTNPSRSKDDTVAENSSLCRWNRHCEVEIEIEIEIGAIQVAMSKS